MAVSDYIKQLQGVEEYAFSWQELVKNCNTPESTLRKELSRLAHKNEILLLRQGFYLIIPPRYQKMKKLPIQLYIDKLFTHLNKPYYVALYSAATFHGASHQQIQQDYVMTVSPALRKIEKNATIIQFFKRTQWAEKNIIKRKSDAGLFNISSPALTAIDLIHHQSSLGGINRMLANLEELIEEIQQHDIADLISWYPHKSTLQRFGFLLEELGIDTAYTQPILHHLEQEKFYPVLLRNKKGEKAGHTGNKWKVAVNLKLDTDL